MIIERSKLPVTEEEATFVFHERKDMNGQCDRILDKVKRVVERAREEIEPMIATAMEPRMAEFVPENARDEYGEYGFSEGNNGSYYLSMPGRNMPEHYPPSFHLSRLEFPDGSERQVTLEGIHLLEK